MIDNSKLMYVYTACCLTSVITLLIGVFSTGSVSYGAILAGYCLLILAILIVMVIILSTKNELFTQIFYCLPFLILLGNIGFLMYLNITNQSSIITNLVPVNYYSFTNLTIVLILIQLFFIYKETKSPQFMVTGKISRLTTSYIYLVELITVMCSLVLYVLLTYFKTDG